MNLSDPNDAHYDPRIFDLKKIEKSLNQLRYGGAMDEGEDLRTSLICVTNRLLDLIGYLRTNE